MTERQSRTRQLGIGFAALASVSLVLGLPLGAAAATFSVAADGSGDFPNLPTAMAAVSAPDTVLALAGTHSSSPFAIPPGVTLLGGTGIPADVVVDLLGGGITAAAGVQELGDLTVRATADGLRITTGDSFVRNCVFEFCGGWAVRSDDPVAVASVVDSEFRDNTRGLSGRLDLLRCSVVDNGRGVLAYGATQIADCEFARGSSHVDAAPADSLFVTNCTFEDGTATVGGALSLPSEGYARVVGSEFEHNAALSWGGAISSVGSVVELEDCDFRMNQTMGMFGPAGAVALYNSRHAEQSVVRNCRFESNLAAAGAALAVRYDSGTLVIEGCEFLNDQAAISGGAIEVLNSADVVLRDSHIEGSTCGGDGASVDVVGSSVLVEDSSIRSGVGTPPVGFDVAGAASSEIRRTLLGGADANYSASSALSGVLFDCSHWYPANPRDATVRDLDASSPGLSFFAPAYCGADSVPTNSFAAGRDGCDPAAGVVADCEPTGIYVQTVPPGLPLRIDGVDVIGGDYVSFTPGASLLVEAEAGFVFDAGTRFTFVGWSDGGAATHSALPAGYDDVLVATYAVEHELNLTTIGNGTTTPPSGFYPEGSLTLEAVADSGWRFLRWQGDLFELDNPLDLTWRDGLDVEAVFSGEDGSVLATFSASHPGPRVLIDGSNEQMPYTAFWEIESSHVVGAESQVIDVNSSRLTFSHWESGRPRQTTIVVEDEISDVAHYDLEHLITFTPTDEGQVPGDQYVPDGETLQIEATPILGMLFDRWVGTGDGAYSGPNNPAIVTSLGRIEQQALFVPDSTLAVLRVKTLPSGFDVRVDGELHSTPYEAIWPRDSSVEIEAIPPIGWQFDQWEGTGNGSYDGPDNPVTVTILESIEQTAVFGNDPNQTLVRIDSEPSGYEVTLNGEVFSTPYEALRPRGEELTVVAEALYQPEPGVRASFNRWASGEPREFTVTLDEPFLTDSLYVDEEYLLTMNSEPRPAVLTPGTGWFPKYAEITIRVQAGPADTFVGWIGTGEGSYTGTDSVEDIYMGGPITQTARVVTDIDPEYEFRLSGSATSPGDDSDVPANGVREVHLWVTCAPRGMSALEATVSGTLPVSGFNPAPNVLNAGSPTELLLAIGGCPSGYSVSFRLGSFLVWDEGGNLCLEGSGQDALTVVDCDPVNPTLTTGVGIYGFTTAGGACFVEGPHDCYDPPVSVRVSQLRAEAGDRKVHVRWQTTAEVDHAGFRIYRSAGINGPWDLISGEELFVGSSPYDFADGDVRPDRRYFYEVGAVDSHGHEDRYGPVEITTPQWRQLVTALAPVRPNPFTREADIAFSLAAPGPAKLEIYDVTGRLVRRLVEGMRPAGEHVATWDGRDGSGRVVPAGVYFSRFEAGGVQQSRKIVRTGAR